MTVGANTGPIGKMDVQIPAGATGLSEEVRLLGLHVLAIQMPADWTAANLTLQGKPGYGVVNDTFQNVYDASGNEVTITAADDRYIVMTGAALDALFGLSVVKFRSGTSGTPVDQTTERTLTLITVPIT